MPKTIEKPTTMAGLFAAAADQPWKAKPFMKPLLTWAATEQAESNLDPMETARFAWFNNKESLTEDDPKIAVFYAYVAGLRTAALAFGLDK